MKQTISMTLIMLLLLPCLLVSCASAPSSSQGSESSSESFQLPPRPSTFDPGAAFELTRSSSEMPIFKDLKLRNGSVVNVKEYRNPNAEATKTILFMGKQVTLSYKYSFTIYGTNFEDRYENDSFAVHFKENTSNITKLVYNNPDLTPDLADEATGKQKALSLLENYSDIDWSAAYCSVDTQLFTNYISSDVFDGFLFPKENQMLISYGFQFRFKTEGEYGDYFFPGLARVEFSLEQILFYISDAELPTEEEMQPLLEVYPDLIPALYHLETYPGIEIIKIENTLTNNRQQLFFYYRNGEWNLSTTLNITYRMEGEAENHVMPFSIGITPTSATNNTPQS